MFFFGGSGRRPGCGGAFVESLVFDAVLAHTRMTNPDAAVGRNVKNLTEWEVYSEVLARFLGVDPMELRTKLIEERTECRDLRLCSDRIFFWAYRKARPW